MGPTPLDDFLFDLRGFLVVRDAIDATLLSRLNGAFDRMPPLEPGEWVGNAQRRDYTGDTGFELHNCVEFDPAFEELIDHPGWIDHARHYAGEERSYVEGLFIDECIASIRRSGGHHPVHSGGHHAAMRTQYRHEHGVFRCGQMNVLLALTDIGPGDGATMVVPGSHKSNLPHPLAGDYARGDRMDSLLSRHMWMHETAEWIAYRLSSRIFCVTEKLRDAVAIKHPGQAGKAEHLSVSVDPDVFAPTPFDTADGVLRIVYAGRLDAFKDPELMFEAARRLHARLGGKFEFHYCGAADPHRFPQFAAIEPFTVRHGALTPDGVAKVMARVHMGWLTSHFEGMPCFLLELLASGRPFTGLRLPQFDKVVRPGVSGLTTDRTDDRDETADNVAATAAELWARIRAGAIDPQAVAASIVPLTVANQLSRLFQAHEALAFGGRATPARDAAQTA